MKHIIFGIVLLSACSFGSEETPDSTPEKMFKNSDVVAIVNLRKGERIDSLVKVCGTIKMQFKGNAIVDLCWTHDLVTWGDPPVELGADYLVHLKCEKSECNSINLQYSIFEVGRFDKDREDIENIFKNIRLSKEGVIEKNGYVWYPELCTLGNSVLCEKIKKILDYSFTQNTE